VFVVSFPGGLTQPEDSDNVIQTAIRETEEEIGIGRNNITILGKFHDVTTTIRKELAISSVIGISNRIDLIIKIIIIIFI
jgi:8-oxo-dGTP pyrophosphatase MutT (NUDIX family)